MDHQRALKATAAFEESIGRRFAELELGRAVRQVRDVEHFYHNQISSLKERIGKAAEELDRSTEERSIMNSKLQNAQMRIDQLNSQLREAESVRNRLERDMQEQAFKASSGPAKSALEMEILSLRRQLEAARESERSLSLTASRAETKSDTNRREIQELERELRALRNENMLLQAKIQDAPKKDMRSVISTIKPAPARPAVAKRKEPEAPTQPIKEEPPATPTPVAAPVSTPLPLSLPASVSEQPSVSGLSIALETAAKKKIKLPDRNRPALSANEVPRSAVKPAADSEAMNSIISNFNVKIPAKK